LQGDVVKLITADGTVKALYNYDPWGKILSITDSDGASVNDTHIAKLNGLRYRGYHGDNETQWYYLQSRYYDPFTRRFVNADTLASTGQGATGTNMFAYCLNNPVCRIDISGEVSIWYYLINALQMAYIHIRVQERIVRFNSGIAKELWVAKNNEQIGRADLVGITTSSVWEVKHLNSKMTLEAGIMLAQTQARKYIGAETVRTGTTITGLGAAEAFGGTFVVNCLDSTYEVEYFTPAAGAVLYTVREIEFQANADYAFNYVPARNKQRKMPLGQVPAAVGVTASVAVPMICTFGSGGGSALLDDMIFSSYH